MTLGRSTGQALTRVGLTPASVARRVEAALEEDLEYGPDITTLATVPSEQRVHAEFTTRAAGVLCGLPVVYAVLDVVIGADRWEVVTAASDGDLLRPGDVALALNAPTVELLTAERTALNFLGHLSGVATLTAGWVAEVNGTGVQVRDTRKTIPGLRVLDKYAVRCGGGVNHRMGLGDAALVKDNHVVAAGGVAAAVAAVRALDPNISLEVECDSLDQVLAAVEADVSLVLLDNMSVAELSRVVKVVRGMGTEVWLEASGGLTLENVRAVAETGVEYVAVGALTHSAPVLDLGLDVRHVVDVGVADRVSR